MIGCLVFGAILIWVIFLPGGSGGTNVFDAVINHDCAPWDGAGFMVSIKVDPVSVIRVSIWRSPDIKFPTSFYFPDGSGNVGNALLEPLYGSAEPLSGEVDFQKVDADGPVMGEFTLSTENGMQYQGKFNALWGNEIVMCG
jgi:hypothetical protein